MTRKVIDWESVEIQYRAGIRSLKDIGREFDVSDAAIVKRAKRDGWTRDLKAKIHAKAESKVSESLVSAEVSSRTRVREREVIEANAQAVANVRLAHRTDIQRSRRITMSLLEELEGQTGAEAVDLLSKLGDLMRSDDDKGQDKLNDLYHKIISLPGRARTMKDLGESLRVLVALERQAFGMDDKDNAPEDALTALLRGISQGNGNAFRPVREDPEHAPKAIGGAIAPVAETEED